MQHTDPAQSIHRALERKRTRREVIKLGGSFLAAAIAAPVLAACGGQSGGGAGSQNTPTTSTGVTQGSSSGTPTTSTSATSPVAGTVQPSTSGTSGPSGVTSSGKVPYKANTNVKGNLTFWHFWGSPARHTAVRRIIAEFQQMYPNVKINDTNFPFGDIWTKNLAAVASGSGMPNVIVSNRPTLLFDAQNNVYDSLGDFAKKDGISGDAFWPFTWKEAVYKDQPWGLPYETDIRVLYYNKAAFTDAGLDPSKPPKNWDDLWSYADKLDQKKGNSVQRMAFYPTFGSVGWDQWAWDNGGSWMDKNYEPTFTMKANVDTLAWGKKWTDRYGGNQQVKRFQSGFGQGSQDGFMTGKLTMKTDIQGYMTFLNFYNPEFKDKKGDDVGYDVAAITPAKGHKPAALSGGFSLSIPHGAGEKDASWEFIKYMVFVGQESWARDTYAMPTVTKIAKQDPILQEQPHWKFFVQAMSYGHPAVVNPYDEKFMDPLSPAFDAVMDGKQSPQQALEAAQKQTKEAVAAGKKKAGK